MKGYINKRAKIKYETTPSAPEITGEYVKEIAKQDLELGDLKNVSLASIADESLLAYNYDSGRWENKLIYNLNNFEWIKLPDVIADGSGSTVRVSFEMVYNVLGIFIRCENETAASDGSFGIVVEFGLGDPNPTRRAIGDVVGGLSASGKRYINAHYGYTGKETSKLWSGTITEPNSVPTATGVLRERLDGFYASNRIPTNLEFRTTTAGLNIPAGSKYEIWIYGNRIS